MSIKIKREMCAVCEACVRECPNGILQIYHGASTVMKEGCIGCGHCFAACPIKAISFEGNDTDGWIKMPMDEGRLNPDLLMKALKSRRSVRRFSIQDVEREKIELILEAARFSPTGANLQGNEFMVLKNQLKEITASAMAILKKTALGESGYENGVLRKYASFLLEMVENYEKDGKDGLFHDAKAVVLILGDNETDAILATANAELMGNALGLGCCHIGFFRHVAETGQMRELLPLPEGKKVYGCLALGYSAAYYHRSPPRKKKEIIWR